MPTVKDLSQVVGDISQQIKAIYGVNNVYVWGSYAQNITNPSQIIKDIDIIAATVFDSGDLLAIDNSRYSALRIRPNELEDEGFNPKAVAFTKSFLALEKYNVDHWAASKDGKLLHWGVIPDNQNEWSELHADAEKAAQKATSLTRAQLKSQSDEIKKNWKIAYDKFVSKTLADSTSGWYSSQHSFAEIVPQIIEL